MFHLKPLVAAIALVGLALVIPTSTQAAQFYSGPTLNFSASDKLKDAYIAGNTVIIKAPVTNDLVVAGGTVSVQQNVSDGLLAAGGTLTVDGNIGHSARLAGGTIVINGHVARDVVVAGGTITITNTAAIDGDLIVFGGNVTVDGPVAGQLTVKGGHVTINTTIGSVKDSQVDSLTLGSKAIINGDLNYHSPQEAQLDQGAVVKGQTNFSRSVQHNNQFIQGFSAFSFFYGIMASLIFSLVLLFMAHKVTNQSVLLLKQQAGTTLAWGLGAVFLFPIVALIATILSIYLGLASFLLYMLCMVVAVALAQILLGWWLLNWWFGRTKESYHLDWRSAVVGVLVATVLLLVPVLGIIILAFLFVMAMGTLAQQIWNLRAGS